MKIGIDIRNIGKQRTGDEVVFFNVVKNLAAIDSNNQYLLFTDITNSVIVKAIEESIGIKNKPNFKIITLPCPNKFIWNAWTLPRYLRKNPVDVYHTQYITPFFVSKKTRIMTTIHDISFNFYPQFISWSDLLFLKILIPYSLRRADKIVAVSDFTKNEIIKYYKTEPGKITVFHNAVSDNFKKNDYSDKEINSVKTKYGLPEKFILYIGTMQPRKNIPLLIEAYAKIVHKLGGTKLVIAGKKSHNFDKKINLAIRKNKLQENVLFTGYIDEHDKPILFKISRLFVFPSLYEGFGIPILEAMASGVPVVCSKIEANRETAGLAAVYFDPLSVDDLAEKLYNTSTDNLIMDKLAANGIQRVNFFSWPETAKIILNCYINLKTHGNS